MHCQQSQHAWGTLTVPNIQNTKKLISIDISTLELGGGGEGGGANGPLIDNISK